MATEREINKILDKISRNGKSSLTEAELNSLNSFDGTYSSESSDEISFDKDGNLLVDGKGFNESQNKKKEEKKKEDNSTKKNTKIGIVNHEFFNTSILKSHRNRAEDFFVLSKENGVKVSLYRFMNTSREYFITFNNDKNDPNGCIRLCYNLNDKSIFPYRVYNRDNKQIKMGVLYNLYGRTFNNAWWHVENDFGCTSYEG